MTININGTTGISGVDGSAGTPAIQGSDTNTGVFFGTNTIDLSTDGTSRLSIGADGDLNVDSGTLFVDASTNRVGIGTTSPASTLHVDASGGGVLRVSRISSSASNHGQLEHDGSNTTLSSTTNTIFFNNSSERARIDSSGRLLVNHTSAVTNLKFGGSGDFGSRSYVYGENEGFSNGLAILNYDATAGIPAILKLASSRNDTRGNNTAPSGSGDTCASIQMMGNDGTRFIDLVRLDAFTGGTPGTNDMPGVFRILVTRDSESVVTERLRINSAGGIVSFTDSSENFVVRSAQTGSGGTPFRVVTAATGMDDGTERMVVRTDGDLENSNGSYTALSDVSLKENIVDANSQWSDIKQLQIRNFNFRESTGLSTHTQLGLIAQEVETVSPGLVKTRDRVVNEETGETVSTKSVNLSVLYMKAVKALQEAMERIETLEARLSVLEGGAN